MVYSKRIFKLRKKLKQLKIHSLLVVAKENIRYLCGFTGSIAVLLTLHNTSYLIVDSRYTDQARLEAKKVKVIETKLGKSHLDSVIKILKGREIVSIGFEEDNLNSKTYLKLKQELKRANFKPAGKLIESLRAIKDKEEIINIKKAIKIAEKAFQRIEHIIVPGVTEEKIASELVFWIRELGGRESFEPIVSSGKRTVFPHALSSKKVLKPGETVIIDFGAVFNGYCSDITRTLVLGKPSLKQKRIYKVVSKAQNAAIAAVKSGKTCRAIDKVPRRILKNYFKHGTGHGIGLSVHESPKLTIGSKDTLAKGMVLTIEPGVYMRGWGGMRIEDMVLVTRKGYKLLTSIPRKLTI